MSNLFSRGYNKRPSYFKSLKADSIPCEETTNEVEVPKPITLDSQQEIIVNSTEKNIVVVAGAGSGKTRVLTERIKHLIKDLGVSAHSIVAITFTNAAAEEMKLRLSDINTVGEAFIGTIHSFANHIMKESGERYQLLTDELDMQLHKTLIEKYCENLTYESYLKYKDLESEVARGKAHENVLNNFFTPSEWSDFNTLHFSCEIVEEDIKTGGHLTYGESIKTLCKKRGIITFDELLIRARKYFESLNTKLEYVFVDEFQDVGSLEYNFIQSLNAENYFFVGDDFQSIYGFKGGNVRIFKSLVEDSDFCTYYLTNNYRNSTSILETANFVINQVYDKIPKDITPKVSEKGDVSLLSKASINTTLYSLKNDRSLKDWFILVRTNKELFELSRKCEDLNIPYVTFKREGMSLKELNKLMATNCVKLLTVHTSKGLEADNVIMYGNFPLTVPNYRKNDDERKVMYVGITRARKKLIILN